MTLKQFNELPREQQTAQLATACGARRWHEAMIEKLPFTSTKKLLEGAATAWYSSNEADWQEAFSHHPKIGDLENLKEKFAGTQHLASKEQAGVSKASTEIIQNLVTANREYEARFGFIFIVCATGKSAEEMLRLLQERLKNNMREELHIAMGEQFKITVLRLKKLFSEEDWQVDPSQVTSHVLDTSIGKPAGNVIIRLKKYYNDAWETLAQGITDSNGRAGDLIPPGRILPPADYKITFDTADYYLQTNQKGFYPSVEICFTVTDDSHYHVPLLINPFGYSTYRGS